MEPYVAFTLVSTKLGPMLINRFDRNEVTPGFVAGVGAELLERGEYQPAEALELLNLIRFRRECFGDGVTVIDVGANIGVRTIEWADAMRGWGSVVAIEAQERVFYALAGNIALNNCFNARAIHAVAGASVHMMGIPELDHTRSANFGGLHLRHTDASPGQDVDYESLVDTRVITLDSLRFPRVDLIKIDVEGMEAEVLTGAQDTLRRYKPMIYAEHTICGLDALKGAIPDDYRYVLQPDGANALCFHEADPIAEMIRKA